MASFSLKPSSPPWSRTLPLRDAVLFACIAMASALPYLDVLPGLHADEAFAGLRAQEILADHAFSWFGMNSHVGPLHQLLVAANFAIFGPSVWALRCVGMATNGLAVGLYAWVTGQLFGRRTAVLSASLLVTAPFFVASARTATEHAALSALLALGAITCLLRSRRSLGLQAAHADHAATRGEDNPAQVRFSLAAGALLGLGTWNHLVFLAVPVTLLVWALCAHGPRMLLRPQLLWTAFGWACVEAGPLSQLGSKVRVQGGHNGVLQRMSTLPGVLADVFQGDVVALRVAGVVRMPMGPWAVALLLLALTGLLAAAFDLGGSARRARWVLLTSTLMAVFTAFLVPAHAERHLLLPMWCMPWVVCEGLGGLARVMGPRGRTLATSLCLVLALAQGTSSYVNMLAPLAKSEAVARVYPFGPQFETSNHVLDTSSLYQSLVERGVTQVRAQFFIAAPLRFYDLRRNLLAVDEVPTAPEGAADILSRSTDAAAVPFLTYGSEWPALRLPLQARFEAAGLQQPVATTAALGSFTLVQLQPSAAEDPQADR